MMSSNVIRRTWKLSYEQLQLGYRCPVILDQAFHIGPHRATLPCVRTYSKADITGAWRIAIILLHGTGIIHGRVLRACAASCAGIHTQPFQGQRGVNRTPYRPRLSGSLRRAKTVVFRWSAAIQPGFFEDLPSDSCFWHR
jgi:hypothetical protein